MVGTHDTGMHDMGTYVRHGHRCAHGPVVGTVFGPARTWVHAEVANTDSVGEIDGRFGAICSGEGKVLGTAGSPAWPWGAPRHTEELGGQARGPGATCRQTRTPDLTEGADV